MNSFFEFLLQFFAGALLTLINLAHTLVVIAIIVALCYAYRYVVMGVRTRLSFELQGLGQVKLRSRYRKFKTVYDVYFLDRTIWQDSPPTYQWTVCKLDSYSEASKFYQEACVWGAAYAANIADNKYKEQKEKYEIRKKLNY